MAYVRNVRDGAPPAQVGDRARRIINAIASGASVSKAVADAGVPRNPAPTKPVTDTAVARQERHLAANPRLRDRLAQEAAVKRWFASFRDRRAKDAR